VATVAIFDVFEIAERRRGIGNFVALSGLAQASGVIHVYSSIRRSTT